MKLKLEQIVEATNQPDRMTPSSIQEFLAKELPVKLFYKVSKLSRKLFSEYQAYIDGKNKLVKQYGVEEIKKEKTPDGKEKEIKTGNFSINPTMPTWNKYIEEIKLLEKVEVEIDFDPIKIEELGDIKTLKGSTMVALDFMFKK